MSSPHPQYIILERRVPSANMARFYVLSLEDSLFGDTSLVRRWGRIGSKGQHKIELYGTIAHAVEALEMWLRRKQRRGYIHRA